MRKIIIDFKATSTSSTVSNLGQVVVNRKRQTLQGNSNSIDSSSMDNEVIAFFSGQGASSTTVSYTE